jgi:hypothetical protein
MKRLVRPLLPLIVLIAALTPFITPQIVRAEGAKTCAGPFPPITSLPYTDTGDTNNATTDSMPSYPASGSPGDYANELLYQITLYEGNNVAFKLTGTPNVTDLALFIVTTCGDAETWVTQSTDFINDVKPEVIESDSYEPGTYYIAVEAYTGDPGYPKYGPYTLEITGTLGDAPPTTPVPTATVTSTPAAGTATPEPTSDVTQTATPDSSATPAVIPTATSTATPDASGRELLFNGGFETSSVTSTMPDFWTLKNPSGDKRKCKLGVAFEGDCFYQFKSSVGERSSLRQSVIVATADLGAGDTLVLGGAVNAKGTVDTSVRVAVKYVDETLAKGKITVTVSAPTTGYQPFSAITDQLSLTLAGDPAKIKVELYNRGTSGKVRYDALSLTVNEGSARSPLPLP